jgi:hypothetical protein
LEEIHQNGREIALCSIDGRFMLYQTMPSIPPAFTLPLPLPPTSPTANSTKQSPLQMLSDLSCLFPSTPPNSLPDENGNYFEMERQVRREMTEEDSPKFKFRFPYVYAFYHRLFVQQTTVLLLQCYYPSLPNLTDTPFPIFDSDTFSGLHLDSQLAVIVSPSLLYVSP